jgi:uncharacterized protein
MGTNAKLRRASKLQLSLVVIAFLVTPLIIKAMRPEAGLAVSFHNPDGSVSHRYQLEAAVTPDQRNRGLMFRREMADDSGMIFIYPAEADNQFWMKNTHLPLDIVFIDSNMKVVGVAENTKPFSMKSVGVGKKSKFVVELLAGQAKLVGIREGSVLKPQSPIPNSIG